MSDFKTIRNLWYCKTCECNTGKNTVGFCKSRHPESLRRVIEMQGNNVVTEECDAKITPFPEIESSHINSLIMTECILVQLSEQSIYNLEKHYNCPENTCGKSYTAYADDYKEILNKDTYGMCEDHEVPLLYDRSTRLTADLRKVMFQEPTDTGRDRKSVV